MNLLFLTMSRMTDVRTPGIYTDLMRKFREEGHEVYVVSPCERRLHLPTCLKEEDGVHLLSVKTLNVQKTNVIEKGIGQVSMERLYRKAIQKHFRGVDFDLILYSTPPITLVNVIRYLKKRNPAAKTYLLLKDIFPQNAVDLGMLATSGPKSLLYRSFRRKEKELYRISDAIGCMSPANVEYVRRHNPEIAPEKVEVAPNSVILRETCTEKEGAAEIRRKYGLPEDRPVFIYGGNLGKPQGIPFLIRCLDAVRKRTDCHFVVIGSGTEQPKLAAWAMANPDSCVSVMEGLPKEEYDALAASCDVGLIFLDFRFTIPNYPSRLLAYMQGRKPVIACTDTHSDVGTLAEANGYGYFCPSNDAEAFVRTVERMLASDRAAMGEKGYAYLCNNYLVEHTYEAIMKHFA